MLKSVALFGLVVAAAVSHATTLDSTVSVDNHYSLYLSTSDSALGSLIGSGNDWTTAQTFTGTTLNAGQDYYLHLVGTNEGDYNSGNPAAFIGKFTLNGSDHKFSNGTSSLLTGDAAWSVNNTGFGNPMVATTDFGANGTGIWQSVSGHSIAGVDNAHWVWAADAGVIPTAYFSTKVQAVPEPTSIAALACGALGLLRRRKK